MSRAVPRWYRARCEHCGCEHGFTGGALAVLVGKMDQVLTIGGNTLCLLTPLYDHIPHSTDPRFAFTEKVG